MCGCLFRRDYLISKAIFNRLLCREIVDAVRVFGNALDGLTCMAGEDLKEGMALAHQFTSANFDVTGLSLYATEWLVDDHCRVGQAEAFTLGASRHQD